MSNLRINKSKIPIRNIRRVKLTIGNIDIDNVRVKSNIINKEYLRQIVFSNKTDKLKLEQIIHPLVNKSKKEFELSYRKKKSNSKTITSIKI